MADLQSWKRAAWAGKLTADLDGDGRREQVVVVRNERAPERCRFLVVARSRSSSLFAPLFQPGQGGVWRPVYSLPRLARVVHLGADRTPVLVAAVGAGASTTAYGFWRETDGRLVRLSVRFAAGFDDLPVGAGSTATFTLVCTGKEHSELSLFTTGRLVATQGESLRVDQDVYALRGSRLERVRHVVFQMTLRTLRQRVSEPFTNCD